MLTLVVLVLILFVGTVASLFLLGSILPSGSRPEVTVVHSPRRAVEEMTVNEFRDLARQYLEAQDWTIIKWDPEQFRVQKRNLPYEIKFDFEAKAGDPREINGMIVEMKKTSVDGLVIFTLADPPESARKLADRSNIELIPPEPLIEWKRSHEQPQN